MISGRWAEIINNEGTVGVLWTDQEKFGFVPHASDKNEDFINDINYMITASQLLDLSADKSFDAVFSALQETHDFVAMVSEGTQRQLAPVLAAAGLPIQQAMPTASPYTISINEENQVVGLAYETDETAQVRENGQWVEPVVTEEELDERYYSDSFQYVNEKAVELYDKLVKSNPTPSVDEFNEVKVD